MQIHSDKIKLLRFAHHLYFAGDLRRYAQGIDNEYKRNSYFFLRKNGSWEIDLLKKPGQ